jgi:hypothetical protein
MLNKDGLYAPVFVPIIPPPPPMKPLPLPSPKEKYNAQDGVEGDMVVEHGEQSFPFKHQRRPVRQQMERMRIELQSTQNQTRREYLVC